MKKSIKVLAISAICILFVSCINDTYHGKKYYLNNQSAITIKGDSITIDQAKITVCNHCAFIPIFLTENEEGNGSAASQFPELVLSIISTFKNDYPNLKITHWKIQQSKTGVLLEGIWIDYELISDPLNQKKVTSVDYKTEF